MPPGGGREAGYNDNLAANFKLLLLLLVRPAAALSGILDRGSLLFACCAALAAGFCESHLVPGPGFGFYMPLLILAAIYIPGVLVIAVPLGRLGGMGTVFQRDYSTLLASAAMSWTAAQAPYIVLALLVPTPALVLLFAAAQLYFIVLMFFAVRGTFGIGNGAAAGIMALSWLPLVAAALLWAPLSFLLSIVASPFFLIFAWYFLAADFSRLGAGMRSRQSFHKMLQIAALNPHDGDAQYQLGLIYQQRRRYSEAIERFENAVRIDPTEADAHFQLGRIARAQGHPQEALRHFQAVERLDERHSSSEIRRELGATYLELENYPAAKNELAVYVERRPYDPEGLFYYGEALERLGETAAAKEAWLAAVEADRTAPRYRRRITARWSRAAQKQLRKLG